MSLSRNDLLGSSLLLWSGAALLALYLVCHPEATDPQNDRVRLWGIVLGLTFLGAALSARTGFPWLLLLGTLPLLFLPSPLNRRWGAVALAGTAALGGLLLAVRARFPARPGRGGSRRRPERRERRGRPAGRRHRTFPRPGGRPAPTGEVKKGE
jgi:hypothetical protein